MARAYNGLGRPDKAILSANAAIELSSFDSGAYIIRGQANAKLGNHSQALSDFSYSNRYESLINKGKLLLELDRYREAASAFDTAIDDPEYLWQPTAEAFAFSAVSHAYFTEFWRLADYYRDRAILEGFDSELLDQMLNQAQRYRATTGTRTEEPRQLPFSR